MKKAFLSLILILLTISLFSNNFANTLSDGKDIVYLKNGIKVEGAILEQTDVYIRMDVTSQGEVTIKMDDIDRIITQINEGDYSYTITSRFPEMPKTEAPVAVTKPATVSENYVASTPKYTGTPKTTYKFHSGSFFPEDVIEDLGSGYLVSNFYLEARGGLGSGIAYCENMPYGLTGSYNHPGTMGISYSTLTLSGGILMLFGKHCGFDFNIGYTQDLGVATYRDEFASQGLKSPNIGMSMFDMYFGFLLGHRLRLGFTCAIGSAYSNGDDWSEHDNPNYNPPMICNDDMNAGSDFAFRWGVDLGFFFTPRFGITVFGRSCDVDNNYTYYQPYPLNDIYIDNNSSHMSLGIELNLRIQPKCYNVKEVLEYHNYGSYAIERSRVWQDCGDE